MANQREKSKRLVGYFATPAEKAALKKLAQRLGYKSLAAFFRALATGEIKLSSIVFLLISLFLAVDSSADSIVLKPCAPLTPLVLLSRAPLMRRTRSIDLCCS